MKQTLTKILSVLMFAVFFYGTAPREYIHDLFAHHTDTVDPIYKQGQFIIGTQHKHCSFLSIDFGAFLKADEQTIVFAPMLVHVCKWVLPQYNFTFSYTHGIASLRGPPLV